METNYLQNVAYCDLDFLQYSRTNAKGSSFGSFFSLEEYVCGYYMQQEVIAALKLFSCVAVASCFMERRHCVLALGFGRFSIPFQEW